MNEYDHFLKALRTTEMIYLVVFLQGRLQINIFVVLFQGHVYPCEHCEHIRGAFRWLYAEKLKNFDFYENLRFQKTFGPL